MDSAHLRYPKKSHRKAIVLPIESEELAELLGIIAGDGGINNDWQLVISLNSLIDQGYAEYIAKSVANLFSLRVAIRKRPGQNTLVVVCTSTSLIEYLVKKGAVRGNKIQQGVDMPLWIKENTSYAKTFLRGLFDTDGCTFIDHHVYKAKMYYHVGVAFTNYSGPLLESTYTALRSLGYSPTTTTKGRILLRKEQEVLRFFEEIKPGSQRHTQKLKQFLEEYRSGYNGTVSKAVVAVR